MSLDIAEFPAGPVPLHVKALPVQCRAAYDLLDTSTETGKRHVRVRAWIGNLEAHAVVAWDMLRVLPAMEEKAMAILGVANNGTFVLLGMTVNGYEVEVSQTS